MEDRNKPTVTLVNRGFMNDAMTSASSLRMPGLRMVVEDIPCECTVMEEIEAGVDAAMGDIVATLTQPLAEEEKSPKPKEMEKLPRVVFKGDQDEVNLFFYKKGWGDGLPIRLPTDEAVEEMLTGTDLPADHLVAKMHPMLGKATVEKIAINAVMAGALPTYMPLLIAAIQARVDPRTLYPIFESCTGSNGPLWIINGPIRNALNINCGTSALSQRDIPNATIARAMGLIVQNIGGVRNGIEAMGTVGSPGRYHMLVGENEEESPFEPLHVEHGLNKDDSAVTLFFPSSFIMQGIFASDADAILRTLVYTNFNLRKGLWCHVMPPANAKTLAGAGWTKKGIEEFISDHSRDSADTRILPPERVRFIVAGGAGVWGLTCASALDLGAKWVTKKVELPANWDKLIAKYKDVVPTHARY